MNLLRSGVAGIVGGLIVLGLGGARVLAQGTAGPAFEVASVREAIDTGGSSSGMFKGTYRAKNTQLRFLISGAYGVRSNLITGLPGWAEATHYDVEAKVDEAEAAAMEKMSPKQSRAEESKLMQALLADRFHLQAKLEEKELPQYDLVIAKGGLKMKEADPSNKYEKGIKNPEGPGRVSFQVMSGKMTAQGFPYSTFVANLEGQPSFDRKIVDKTGLTGNYDFVLQWTPDYAATSESQWPGLFVALEEQLGLKLVPSKGPTQTLVVEHVEQPTAN